MRLLARGRVCELEDWREQLPPGSRHDVFRAFRQSLAWAVDRQLATINASNGVRNPRRKRHERREVLPFESWTDVQAVADELDPRYRSIPFVADRQQPDAGAARDHRATLGRVRAVLVGIGAGLACPGFAESAAEVDRRRPECE